MTAREAARRLAAERNKRRPDLLSHLEALKWSAAADYRQQPHAYRPEGSEGADVTLWPEIAR